MIWQSNYIKKGVALWTIYWLKLTTLTTKQPQGMWRSSWTRSCHAFSESRMQVRQAWHHRLFPTCRLIEAGAITAKRRWSSTLLPKQSSMGYHERLRIVLRCHPTSSRHDTCKVFKIGKSLIQCIASVQRTISCETRHTTSSQTALSCRKGALICMYTNRTIIKCY